MIFSICLIKESFNRLNYFLLFYKRLQENECFSYSSVNTVIVAFYIKNITKN